ncbi:hypothetical protein [Butyrivibrio sp. M55]|uniref:hypothetical protein n=1 Tax=Butyrivibrio sp. M55 TaxID=1855323 RepID=UPI0008F045FB|nr:hypothetical protein [Butyrivibrio sp. M55]SFU74666.1 hypothetical protein SAMN05216540_10828 [Butyrivibrio sp. M55]
MYYDELVQLIEKVLNGDFEKKVLEQYMEETFDFEKIYDSDDELLTDVFFTLKHYLSGEEEVNKKEWLYLKKCLLGRCGYSMEEKMRVITE